MGKNYNAAIAKVDTNKFYNIDDAVKLLPETATAKFDETVDVAVRLGIDPKQSEQMVRGTVVLPNGTGKKVRVLVFAKGEKEKEAKDAGADFVYKGASPDELIGILKPLFDHKADLDDIN